MAYGEAVLVDPFSFWEIVKFILIFLFLLACVFVVVVLAACVALGHMHTWLKEKGEVFGASEALHECIGEVHGQVIEARSEINALARPIELRPCTKGIESELTTQE